MKEEEPALQGPSLAEGWATPLASSVTEPDPTEAPVQVLEVVKNVNVTVPVGVPKAPLTVALSGRKGVVEGKSVDLGGRRIITEKTVGVSAVTSSGSQGLSVAV